MARLNLNVRRWRGMTGIGGGITGRIGGCLGPVVCTLSARMSGAEFSVGLAGACSIVCVSVFCLKGLMHDE